MPSARPSPAPEAGLLAVHGGRCDTSSGLAFGEHHLVTAAHALERETDLEVSLGDERLPATLVGADPTSDLAVLHVERSLTPLPHADASGLLVGHLVLAVSNGARGARARLGIVSRLGGEWRLPSGTSVERYIESDVAPVPSLAGSALLDASGALIGLNATGVRRGALVALPSASVARVVAAIVAHGHVRRAKLGVLLQRVELTTALSERRGQARGLIVLGVAPGGPAERAGLLTGDVLLTVAGTRLGRVEDLQSALDESTIDHDVTVELVRAGAESSVTVRPEAR